MSGPRVVVVAALIERSGRLLIAQRKQTDRHPLKWEFPGGKVESGESPRGALRRELEEELAIRASIGAEITRYEYAYPNRSPITLIFYRVTRFQGEIRNVVFNEIRWEVPENMRGYDFLEGDKDFIERLARAV
jgi:8-oxo-dGTP diphosphatase